MGHSLLAVQRRGHRTPGGGGRRCGGSQRGGLPGRRGSGRCLPTIPIVALRNLIVRRPGPHSRSSTSAPRHVLCHKGHPHKEFHSQPPGFCRRPGRHEVGGVRAETGELRHLDRHVLIVGQRVSEKNNMQPSEVWRAALLPGDGHLKNFRAFHLGEILFRLRSMKRVQKLGASRRALEVDEGIPQVAATHLVQRHVEHVVEAFEATRVQP
mmetsp:Transcript_21789/g.74898  ORF Transcript_21789/g.74898 Transcript_21789/m.74898 type:complete len:210 (-) Transcript_21789:430-1059(-)